MSIYTQHAGQGIKAFTLEREIVPPLVIRQVYNCLRRNEIFNYSLEKFLEHCIERIGADWVAQEGEYVGKFTKRLSRWFYEEGGKWSSYNELPKGILEEIGNLVGNSKPPKEIYWDIPVHNWDWDLTDFSHDSSCFRPGSGYQDLPYIFEQENIFTVRFWEKVNDSAYLPLGRVWIYAPPREKEKYVLFNSYGYNLAVTANFLALNFNLPYLKKISLHNKGRWDRSIWINEGHAYYVGEEVLSQVPDTLDLKIDVPKYQKSHCSQCGRSGIPNSARPNAGVEISLKKVVLRDSYGTREMYEVVLEEQKFCGHCIEGNNRLIHAPLYQGYLYPDIFEVDRTQQISELRIAQSTLLAISSRKSVDQIREAYLWALEFAPKTVDKDLYTRFMELYDEEGRVLLYGATLLKFGYSYGILGGSRQFFVPLKDVDYYYSSLRILKKGVNTLKSSDRCVEFMYSNNLSPRIHNGRHYFKAGYATSKDFLELVKCEETDVYFPKYMCIYAPDKKWYSEYGFRKLIQSGRFNVLTELLLLGEGELDRPIQFYSIEQDKGYSSLTPLAKKEMSFLSYLANYWKKNKFLTEEVSIK